MEMIYKILKGNPDTMFSEIKATCLCGAKFRGREGVKRDYTAHKHRCRKFQQYAYINMPHIWHLCTRCKGKGAVKSSYTGPIGFAEPVCICGGMGYMYRPTYVRMTGSDLKLKIKKRRKKNRKRRKKYEPH